MRRDTLRVGGVLFILCLVVYGLTTYGGVRSPDSELVFRTCEVLSREGSWSVEPLELDPGFGVAPGRGERNYSIFGPLQPVLCVPVYALWSATALAPQQVPPSHYIEGGYALMLDRQTAASDSHRIRFFVSFLNVGLGAVAVVIFFLLARAVGAAVPSAAVIAGLFAFGTLHWWYATTFFSEILATVWMLASLLILVRCEEPGRGRSAGGLLWVTVAAGLLLGLSVATHLSAVLFFPIFLIYAWYAAAPSSRRQRRWQGAFSFAAGFALPVLLVALFNWWRFGDALETGRGVVPDASSRFGYGEWVEPWQNLAGLLASPGKGLLLYCPLVLLGLVAMPALRRHRRALFWVVVSAASVRLLVIAARSDWHGGFGLGPRYLLMIVPLLLLPLASWLSECQGSVRPAVLLLFGFLAVVQQFYFVLGEVFFFYHSAWLFAARSGHPELLEGIYFDWGFSPLVSLHKGGTSPWILQITSLPTWMALVGFLASLSALSVCAWRALVPRVDRAQKRERSLRSGRDSGDGGTL